MCEILEEHALVARSLNGEGEPWVVASWLRDHLLLPKERKDMTLWQKVITYFTKLNEWLVLSSF